MSTLEEILRDDPSMNMIGGGAGEQGYTRNATGTQGYDSNTIGVAPNDIPKKPTPAEIMGHFGAGVNLQDLDASLPGTGAVYAPLTPEAQAQAIKDWNDGYQNMLQDIKNGKTDMERHGRAIYYRNTGQLAAYKQSLFPVEKDLSDLGVIIDAEPEKSFTNKAIDDVRDTLSNWANGGIQGFNEIIRQGNKLAVSNPLALSGTPTGEGMTNTPAPPQTEEQKQDEEQYKKATYTFGQETVKPVLGPLGLVNPYAVAAYVPFLASDIKDSYEKGGVGQVARDLTYGPIVDFATQPNLAQKFSDRPVSTTAEGVMALVSPLILAKGVVKGANRLINSRKGAEIPTKTPVDVAKSDTAQVVPEGNSATTPREVVTETPKAEEPNVTPKTESAVTVKPTAEEVRYDENPHEGRQETTGSGETAPPLDSTVEGRGSNIREGQGETGGEPIQEGVVNQPNTDVTPGTKFTDPNVEKSWQAAAKGAGRASLFSNVRAALSNIWAKPVRAYALLPHTGEFASLRRGLLQLENKANFAKKTAGIFEDVTKGLDEPGLDLYSRKIVFDNLASETGELPFGLTKEAFAREKAAIDNAVANNPQVTEALANRSQIRSTIESEYSKAMGDIGVDVSDRINTPGYFEQQVSWYAKVKALAGKFGAGRNVIADAFNAEHEVMAQMMHDTEMAKVIKTVRDNFDIKSSLQDKFGDKWRENIPEGYTTLQLRDGSSFYLAESLPGKLATEYFKESLKQLGLKPETINDFMAKGLPLDEMVVKQEVADALTKQGTPPTESLISKIPRLAIAAGKKLADPLGIPSSISKTFGDVGKVISNNPSAYGKIGQAARELHNAFYGDHTLTDSLQGWFDRGGMDSFTNVEGVGKAGGTEGLGLIDKVQEGYKNTVKKAADFRDSILSYANYLDYLDQIKKNRGIPENFGVSNREEVMALNDWGDRAYKLANDIRGDEMLSKGGKCISEYLLPDWKDIEIGYKQYKQLIKNGVADEKLAQTVGRAVLGKAAGNPAAVGDIVIKAGAMYAMLRTISALSDTEKKEKVDETTKELPSSIAKYTANWALQKLPLAYTLPMELASGKQYFSSDFFNPREIKDWPLYGADKLNAGRALKSLSRSDVGRWLGMDPRPDDNR